MGEVCALTGNRGTFTSKRKARYMTTTQYPYDWRSQGACLSADPDLFFPVSAAGPGSAQVAEAKAVCGGCQVQRRCLDFALSHSQAHGVWGGTTEEER